MHLSTNDIVNVNWTDYHGYVMAGYTAMF